MLPGANMRDFGTPLAPSGAQNGAQNRPSGAQSRKIEITRLPQGGSWQLPFPKIAFGALMGTRLLDFGSSWAPFLSIFDHFLIKIHHFWHRFSIDFRTLFASFSE